MYIVQLLVLCSWVKDVKNVPHSYSQHKCQENNFPMFREHGEHSCVHYFGHTQWEQGGMESAHVGWWHRTTADIGNSLQGPEKAIFSKLVLGLSYGLCTALFTLCCMNWLYPGVAIVIFSFPRRSGWWHHTVYLCMCTLLSFKLLDEFPSNLAGSGGLKTRSVKRTGLVEGRNLVCTSREATSASFPRHQKPHLCIITPSLSLTSQLSSELF